MLQPFSLSLSPEIKVRKKVTPGRTFNPLSMWPLFAQSQSWWHKQGLTTVNIIIIIIINIIIEKYYQE